MTVIAIDRTYIVADGLCVTGDAITKRNMQKLRVHEVNGQLIIFGVVGLVGTFDDLIEWWMDGHKSAEAPRYPGEDTWWRLIVLQASGLTSYDCRAPVPEYFFPPYAFGSGRDFALGAMWCGECAETAVRRVCENVPSCGGDLMIINYVDLFKSQPAVQEVA